MKKIIKWFVCLFLITALSNASVFAKTCVNNSEDIILATPPPTVTSPLYLCQNSVAIPLTATPLGGGTLNWYLTNAPAEIPSSVAPTPSTTAVGSTTYYVTQTIAGVESSPRTPIVVNVVADTGGTLTLFCDAANTTPTSVAFDWNNVTGYLGYNYSYSVAGGPLVYGFQVAPSHFDVPVPGPGTSVTFTILSVAGLPCVKSISARCNSTCSAAQIITPTFNSTPTTYCLNDVVVLPANSTNVPPITGTWSPSTVDTSTMGTTLYTFTPDSILFPCAFSSKLDISVEPVQPDFTGFSICSGDPASTLSNVSPNGITGIWSPTDTVDSSVLGVGTFPFTFTPDAGQPCTPTDKTINVTVDPSNTIVSLNWTVTDAFSKNQIVTVANPVGANYLYQIDSGPFQTSPVFENVASGLHSITVNDINGCSQLTDENVLVIGYPKYFTPNGDTYNDTWNISGLSSISNNSRIYIFDRYGKLLKDIGPNEKGWDGTYIGQPMPATDYWFTVEYSENNIVKSFKSHFSLKR
jgi:gliding motility-associated-like protein